VSELIPFNYTDIHLKSYFVMEWLTVTRIILELWNTGNWKNIWYFQDDDSCLFVITKSDILWSEAESLMSVMEKLTGKREKQTKKHKRKR